MTGKIYKKRLKPTKRGWTRRKLTDAEKSNISNKLKLFYQTVPSPMKNKHHSEDAKIKISINSKNKRKCQINGVIFDTCTEASKKLNISKQCLDTRLKSKTEQFKNYKYI